MHIDVSVMAAGLLVGFVVGMTGMGGGALMTPILILLFRVPPLAAVSSDLVASFVMRPIGALVHLRRGTVQRGIVLWLSIGSVPSAFAGVLVLRALGNGTRIQEIVQWTLGIALIIAAGAIVLKALINLRQIARGVDTAAFDGPVAVHRVRTLLIGAFGGLVVGMTSVGSGSLIIALLLFLYPRLRAPQLVGTDLLQAIPLVGSAALGHLLFGDFQFSLTSALVIGSVPGVFIGAQVSSHAPPRLVRRALALVLLATGLKLVQVGVTQLGVIMLIAVVIGPLAWMAVRRTDGLMFRASRRAAVSRAVAAEAMD